MQKRKILGVLLAVLMLALLMAPVATLAATTTITPSKCVITIKTEGDKNILVDGTKKYTIDENTDLYLNCDTTIYLQNTVPATINSINARNGSKDVTFGKGTGTLTLNNTVHEHGINVDTLKITGNVTVYANGLINGVKAHDEICITAGALYATGTEFGVWSKGEIYVSRGHLEGLATNPDSIGVYGNDGCYSVKAKDGGVILGEGGACGVWGNTKVYAYDGGVVHGISNNINSGLSAVYSGREIVAYGGCGKGNSKIIEQYRNSGIVLDDIPLVINEAYESVGRNMANLQNYAWELSPVNVVGIEDGGLIATEHYGKGMTLTGTRNYDKNQKGGCCGSKSKTVEPVYLKSNGCQHIVIFDDVEAKRTVDIEVRHYWGGIDNNFDNYELATTTTYEAVPGSVLNEDVYAEIASTVVNERMEYLPGTTGEYEVLPIKEGNVINLYYHRYALVTVTNLEDLQGTGHYQPGDYKFETLRVVGETVSHTEFIDQVSAYYEGYDIVLFLHAEPDSLVVSTVDGNNVLSLAFMYF